MVDILYSWLNTEISLSQKIINIEKDFSNGYLLGEILYKCNQLVNFNEFINRYFFIIFQFVVKNILYKN